MIENEMFTYRKIIVIFILVVAKLTYASDISYDQQYISSQTWQEIDLSYKHKINGKDYTEQAKLLRPTSWLKQYHLDKVGSLVEVHESDVGIDARVKIDAIKTSKLSFNSQSNQKSHLVIGTFLKYSDNVWSYTFSNGETIEATSNHPFYDVDKKQYIPIGEFQLNGDHLLTDSNTKVQLSSKTKHNKGVEAVYNFEVYHAHNYYVSQKITMSNLLVHNGPCLSRPRPQHALVSSSKSSNLSKLDLIKLNTNIDINLNPYNKNEVFAVLKANDQFANLYPSGRINFQMSFIGKTWKFNITERYGFDDFFASDVTRYIHTEAKIKFPKLVSDLPDTIIRGNITNQQTLEVLANLGPEVPSDIFLDTFLTKTVNGKHTQYVLKDFNLKAVSAEFEGFDYHNYTSNIGQEFPDIIVQLNPK